MLLRQFYYHCKPFLPWRVRLALRQFWLPRQRARHSHVWPINPAANRPPAHWTGWPAGKQFAFVLTHDIETQAGLDRCRPLMAVEQRLGFRSSFNFIPEGEYGVPHELHAELAQHGFEVGVHDLRHDGKLYRNRAAFKKNAQRINGYLKEWGAVGFRSGFMLHNLDWLHDLEVEYDASTFDTDPFEPQPDAVDTIFPFWVSKPEDGGARAGGNGPRADVAHPASGIRPPASGISHSASNNPQSAIRNPQSDGGYVELPYTLPQDYSMFVLMREQTLDIWTQKLDWVARHGGMALLDVHPDYMNFNGASSPAGTYPAAYYEDFLKHVRTRYAGSHWHALPREVAAFVKQTAGQS